MSEEFLIPTELIRHKRLLRAVLLEDQCWFCAHDLGRLIGSPYLAERVQRNLDDDQFRRAWLRDGSGDFVDELLISESAVYAALIHFFHPENRSVRQWLSQQVIPTLRDQHRTAPGNAARADRIRVGAEMARRAVGAIPALARAERPPGELIVGWRGAERYPSLPSSPCCAGPDA